MNFMVGKEYKFAKMLTDISCLAKYNMKILVTLNRNRI